MFGAMKKKMTILSVIAFAFAAPLALGAEKLAPHMGTLASGPAITAEDITAAQKMAAWEAK